MPIPIRRGSSPPPFPERSPGRKGVKAPQQEVQNAPAIPTVRYSSPYTVAPAVGSAAEQDIEDPFSDAMARPDGTRHVSRDTVETTNDPIFDDAITQPWQKLSIDTDLTTYEDSSSQVSPTGTPNRPSTSVPSPTRNTEPFPSFNNPTWETASQRSDGPGRVQNKAQTLVSKLKGALQYLENLDQKFERWSSELDEKRLRNRRLRQLRRSSAERVKAIDLEHKAQIDTHKEKEEARNKRAAKQLKEQKKEMKAQAKRRDEAAKDEDEKGFFPSLKKYFCKRGKENSEKQKSPKIETASFEPIVRQCTGVSYRTREVVDDTSSEDHLFFRGADEYDPTRY